MDLRRSCAGIADPQNAPGFSEPAWYPRRDGMFLAPGAKLDKYEIIAPLAVGGMAELYVARIRGLEGFERLCVIKRILPQHARDEQFVKMFLDEARLAATLRHPNVIQVYDVGVVKGRYYFAMEYVHGQDLAALVAASRAQRRSLRVGNAVAIAIGAAAGLHHAHQQVDAAGRPLRIVHRDVSPANILISYDGHVKLVDFGIAKAAARAAQTTAGGFKGKLSYMSPEQVVASPALDHRSDVFSLGVVLYELTTGKPLFRGDSDFLIAEKITSGTITPPGEARPGYDERLAAVVMKALALAPEDRFATAAELQHALEDYARVAQLTTSSTSLAELMRDLFRTQIDEWEVAQQQGRSLADVVRSTSELSAVTIHDDALPTPVRRPAWSRPVPVLATAGVVAAIGGWMIVLAARSPGDASPPAPAMYQPAASTTPAAPPPTTAMPLPTPSPAPAETPPTASPPAVVDTAEPMPMPVRGKSPGSRPRVRRDEKPPTPTAPAVIEPETASKPAAAAGSASAPPAKRPLDQVLNPYRPEQ